MSSRQQDSDAAFDVKPREIESLNTAEVTISGVACEQLDSTSKDKMRTKISPLVNSIIESRDLEKEYDELTEAVLMAETGTNNAFKASALARTMYLLGHEAAFEAKQVSLFLTKEQPVGVTSGFKFSVLKLCFVDRTQQPSFIPPHVYVPEVDFPAPKQKDVIVVPYDGSTLKTDKYSLPVDLLKLLEKTGLIGVNMDMAAQINIGDRSAFWAAKVAFDFEGLFKKHGVKLAFLQAKRRVEHSLLKKAFVKKGYYYKKEYAFAYADLSMIGDARVGPLYNYYYVLAWQECMKGDSKRVAKTVAQELNNGYRYGCGKVAGATYRKAGMDGDCKCPGYDMLVFCGRQQVADRKFGVSSTLQLKACREEGADAYCAESQCRPAHLA